MKDFLKNIGSNFTLKDRSLSFTCSKPFSLVAENAPRLDWRCITAEVRNYFKGSLEVKS
jgi:hypothetical protein